MKLSDREWQFVKHHGCKKCFGGHRWCLPENFRDGEGRWMKTHGTANGYWLTHPALGSVYFPAYENLDGTPQG